MRNRVFRCIEAGVDDRILQLEPDRLVEVFDLWGSPEELDETGRAVMIGRSRSMA
jgi:hypothetical protein